MEKVEEKWSANGVTTILKVRNELHPESRSQDTVYTQVCGFGWRYGISRQKSNVKHTDGLRTLNTFAIQISFDPHLIKQAQLGTLAVSIALKGAAKDSQQQHTYNIYLPTTMVLHLATYLISDIPGTITFVTQVCFSVSLGINLQPVQPRARQVLGSSLSGGEFVDTKFYLFSRRSRPPGRVDQPLSLFANKILLRGQCSYMDQLLFGSGFVESAIVDLDAEFLTEGHADKYDYESDSDLDSEPDTEVGRGEREENLLEPSIIEKFQAVEGDPKRTNELLATASRPSKVKNIKAAPAESAFDELPIVSPTVEPDYDLGPPIESPAFKNLEDPVKRTGRMGRIIVVKDTAFRTWKALIMYIYTNEIYFSSCKLASETGVTSASAASLASRSESCSPKSMYRLADKIGLEDLKALAFEAIRSRITRYNIVEELFSKFTTRYPEIQEIEIQFLCENYDSILVRNSLAKRTIEMFRGEHPPHCADTFMTLFAMLRPKLGE